MNHESVQRHKVFRIITQVENEGVAFVGNIGSLRPGSL